LDRGNKEFFLEIFVGVAEWCGEMEEDCVAVLMAVLMQPGAVMSGTIWRERLGWWLWDERTKWAFEDVRTVPTTV
jgi:hypothetical protein